MHYTQKYLLDKIQNMEWQHNKLMMPLIKRVVVSENAVKRVRELHKPQETMVKPYKVEIICKWCSSDPKYVVYPCSTIQALDGEL